LLDEFGEGPATACLIQHRSVIDSLASLTHRLVVLLDQQVEIVMLRLAGFVRGRLGLAGLALMTLAHAQVFAV
jgi:hypothetical protein